MGAWIMSIVGVICLGILLEIVLPEGQTAKYVKGAFSLLVIFVIVAPLPALFKSGFELNLDGTQLEIDEDYVNSTFAVYSEGIKERAEYTLKSNGYEASVTVELAQSTPVKVTGISVRVFNFKQEAEETVSEDVKDILSKSLRCSADIIDVRLNGA